jgi:hypothetical protein
MEHRFGYPKVVEVSRASERGEVRPGEQVTERPSQRALVKASLLRCPEPRRGA